MGEQYEPWPDPLTIPIVGGHYQTPDGRFPRVTTILKVLGLGADRLQDWAAEVQREADVEAAINVWMKGECDSPADFAAAMLEEVGAPLAHTVRKEAAGDLGTSIHDKVRWWHQTQMGIHLPEPTLPELGAKAFVAYQTWWNSAGLTAVRVEQPVWSKELGCAGTIDLVARRNDNGMEGLVDLKTSPNLYDKFHLQCAGYLAMAQRWAGLRWAVLVRLPKKLEDTRPVEVRQLGQMYDRTLSIQQLMKLFAYTVEQHQLLIAKPRGGA